MNIHDIRNLANCIYRNRPAAYRPQVVITSWAEFVGELADEIAKRSRDPEDGMVTDHRFSAAVFAQVCEGEGQYDLFDPDENDHTYEVGFDPDDTEVRVYTSDVVLSADDPTTTTNRLWAGRAR